MEIAAEEPSMNCDMQHKQETTKSHSRWRKFGAVLGASTLLASLAATTAVGAQTGELCQGQTPTIVGTDGDDTLVGTSGRDVIVGLAGDDIIRGLGGNDLVCGGFGADTIYGGFGNDNLFGNAGPDTILGNAGADSIHGGFGVDELRGGPGPDEIMGSRNADTIYGDAGADTLYGGRGHDTLVGGLHADRLSGGNGNDTLLGGQGPDILRPGSGVDVTDGGLGVDRVAGQVDPADLSSNLDLDLTGLEPLGEGFVYEGWVIIDGAPVSTGRFNIEADGSQTFLTGSLADDVSAATAVVITIEPAVDPDPGPAAAKPLAGDVVNGVAELTVGHPAALGDDFTSAGGQFLVATPTTADNAADDYSGVWFLEVTDSGPVAGLDLPTLPEGWVYEGWAVIDGQPVSTGRFVDPGAPDDFSGFSGPDGAPPYPGEDFIVNAPDGLTFPTDLRGETIVVSIEPADDDSPAPFAFKPLAAQIPADLAVPGAVELGAGPALPTGIATLIPADVSTNVSLDLTGLEPLGSGFVYEGWVIIDGAPVSTGRFHLEADGSQTLLTSSLAGDPSAATAVVLTIEPAIDPDPGPAEAKPLAGDVVDGVAELTIAHPAALGDDFSTAAGNYFVATPTSAATDDDYSGLWFIDVSTGAPTQGLTLPTLPAGWVYEGWAVIDGQPVSTGTFTDPGAPDNFNGFSGPLGAPPYPGEDFIVNAPDGLSFATDIRGGAAVISIEPADDDSPAPFAFKPLAGAIPADAPLPYAGELGANPFPTGVATIG